MMARGNRPGTKEEPARPSGREGDRAGLGANAGQARRRWITLAVLGAVVAGAVVAAHWTALDARALCFDDQEYLLRNSLVRNPSWDSTRHFVTEVTNPSSVRGYYQPLSMISLMLDCAAGGSPDNLLPFRRTSLILHAANSVLAMVLLYLLFHNAWAAAGAALIFGLHPMTVETIPWVGERKTLLAAFFALWAFLFYVRHAQLARDGGPRQGLPAPRARWWSGWLIACGGAYLLAVLAKPTATPLPVVFLLADYWPFRRLSKRAVLEKAPLLLIAAASSAITYISQAKLQAVTRTPETAFLVLCHNIVFYPLKMLWPANLSPHYAFPSPLSLSSPAILAGVIGAPLLLAGLVVSWRWTRCLIVGWAMFFVAIFPTLGLVGFTNVIASDRFAYLPAVGLLVPLAYAMARLWSGETRDRPHFSPQKVGSVPSFSGVLRHVLIVAAVAALASGEVFLTWRYLAAWRDSVSLFRHMLACSPQSPEVQNNLGGFLEAQGEALLARASAEQAAGRRAKGLADAREAVARLREARGCLEEAVRLNPTMLGSHMNLGRTIYQEARAAFVIAAQEAQDAPNDPAKLRQAELAFARRGQARQEAEDLLRQEMTLNPRNFSAPATIGEMAVDYDKDVAIGWYRKSVEINPGYIRALGSLAALLEARGRPGDLSEARRHLQKARQIKPDDPGIAQALRGLEARHPDLR